MQCNKTTRRDRCRCSHLIVRNCTVFYMINFEYIVYRVWSVQSASIDTCSVEMYTPDGKHSVGNFRVSSRVSGVYLHLVLHTEHRVHLHLLVHGLGLGSELSLACRSPSCRSATCGRTRSCPRDLSYRDRRFAGAAPLGLRESPLRFPCDARSFLYHTTICTLYL